jgi:hypothetical protein
MAYPETEPKGFYCDRRVAGVKSWYLSKPEDAEMPIAQTFLRCVCFLCIKTIENGVESYGYGGSAFFVSMGSMRWPEDYSYLYLVTAKHCLYRNGTPRDLYARFNKKDGTAFKPIPLAFNKWVLPEDDAVDLAVMPFDIFEDPEHDFSHIPIEGAAIKDGNRDFGIGLGSEIFVTGLFTGRVGKQRNLPIVRAGIISSLPDELEDETTGLPYTAYLAELQSIGGLSGSPVFAWSQIAHFEPGASSGYKFRLLRLIRGHFDIKRRKTSHQNSDINFTDDEWDKIHNGIAIVTPVGELIKLLDDDELKKLRLKQDRALASQRAPVND